jgi:hypothetical protein
MSLIAVGDVHDQLLEGADPPAGRLDMRHKPLIVELDPASLEFL